MTLRVALIGKPLKRRHSVVMHNAAFAAAGIDALYDLMELDEREVARVVAEAHGPDWLGLGVTAPYKRLVAGLLDEVEEDARQIGAVNNVVRKPDGRLIGFNSDAPGFRAGVELAMGRPLTGLNVVVAGAGGAAHAVVHALLDAGAGSVTIGNRTLPATISGIAVVGLDGPEFLFALRSADLAVNATTVGMLDPGVTIPVEQLPDHATVFDLVYVPSETPLLAAARTRGLRAANGSGMLIAQAAIAFERWTGVADMSGVMREAVTPLLADATARA